MKNIVTFKDGNIFQNGMMVGRIGGVRNDWWVELYPIAHCKQVKKYTDFQESQSALYMAAPDNAKPKAVPNPYKYPLATPTPVARFKHCSKSKPKHFIKFLLERNTPDQIINAIGFDKPIEDRPSPMSWAKTQGYQPHGFTEFFTENPCGYYSG